MRFNASNMSHSKHRSGAFGKYPQHGTEEIARLLNTKPKRRPARMYASMRDLMTKRRD